MADVFDGVPQDSTFIIPPVTPDEIDGAALLDQIEEFLGRFVAYPSEAARIAHTLWIAHTWFMDSWESTPRIAFLSPEPGSGKSRALEVTEPLVPRPVHAVNTTPAYLFRKVSDEAGTPTILYDEIDTVFGPKAKDNEDIRGMLNAGHRRGAVAGRCITKGRIVVTEELPAYCAVAMAGLDDLPDTIHSRSIIIRMRRRAPNERVEPWRHRVNAPEAEPLADDLAWWAKTSTDQLAWPDMPEGIEDRNADVWEALLAVADLAGGEWPQRARVAAVAHVADSKAATPSLGVRLLADLRTTFGDRDAMGTEEILTQLKKIDEAPWGDLRGKELDARGLAARLRKYEITRADVRVGDWHGKGYKRADLWDAWERYLPALDVSVVTDVTDSKPASPSTGDTDTKHESQTINTEDVIKRGEGADAVAEDVGLAGYTSVTSVTSVTNGQSEDGCLAVGDWGACVNGNCKVFGACVQLTP
jgi:hypothetical protein